VQKRPSPRGRGNFGGCRGAFTAPHGQRRRGCNRPSQKAWSRNGS
jgi:hypothetical protein